MKRTPEPRLSTELEGSTRPWVHRAGLVLGLSLLLWQLLFPVYGLWLRGGFPFAAGNLPEAASQQVYFAWQMYSTSPTPREHTLIDRTGKERTLDPVELYGWRFGRASFDPALTERLCRDHPGTRNVVHAETVTRCP